MRFARAAHWRLPMLVGLLVFLPVLWAWPADIGGWRAAGIVAGWLAFGLWSASLLLMLREARLAAWLGGLERMYRWHHVLGSLAYPFVLMHPLLLAGDLLDESPNAAWSLLSPGQAAWAELSGWLALLMLVPGMGIAMQPGIAYRHWRAWHLLLVAPVVLAVLHLYALGLSYVLLGTPALAAFILLWRYLRSDCGLGAQPYIVTDVAHPQPGIVEARLRPLSGVAGSALAKPGQFVLLAFGSGGGFHGCGEFHPFTLSAIEEGGQWRVAIKALGTCSSRLQALRAGVPVRAQGPFGEFLGEAGRQPALWLAGGIGITPFMARLRVPDRLAETRLLFFVRSPTEVPYAEELDALTRIHPTFSWEVCVAGPEDDLARFLPEAAALAGRDCYLCGPPAWMERMIGTLRQQGVSEDRIHFERFEFR